MGNPRGFYPLQQATVEGSYKIANSYVINDGFRSTTGVRENYTQPDVPYLKITLKIELYIQRQL